MMSGLESSFLNDPSPVYCGIIGGVKEGPRSPIILYYLVGVRIIQFSVCHKFGHSQRCEAVSFKNVKGLLHNKGLPYFPNPLFPLGARLSVTTTAAVSLNRQ